MLDNIRTVRSFVTEEAEIQNYSDKINVSYFVAKKRRASRAPASRPPTRPLLGDQPPPPSYFQWRYGAARAPRHGGFCSHARPASESPALPLA